MANMNQAMTDLLRYNAGIGSIQRSRFDKSHSHTTTFDSGALVPLMVDRVLPGDEKKIQYSGLARMATPIHPVMDQAFFDVSAFYVPDRLWYAHAKEFYGENKDAEFNPDGEYVLPYLTPQRYAVRDDDNSQTGYGSLNDYFGFPVMSDSVAAARSEDPDFYVSAGLHRCYQLIWNEYYRNSSIQPSLRLNDGDTVTQEEWEEISQLRYVNKYPDYFTTLLKEPQSGPDVLLPLGDYAPIIPRNENVVEDASGTIPVVRFMEDDGTYIDSAFGNRILGTVDGTQTLFDYDVNSTQLSSPLTAIPRNLWADLTNQTNATINNLRAAITAQHLFELQNRAGKRYQQILYATWSVLTPDATLQRPLMLGTSRTEVGMRQVLQTSEGTENSPLGNTGAFSLTSVNNEWICNQAFTEPGIIMVLGAVRPVVSYSQGLNVLWAQLTPFEQYQPVFDDIGDQPVYNYEIYSGDNATVEQLKGVLGYKPAWQEYRIMQNRVSGKMRPDVTGTLSSWNYSLNFVETPELDGNFIAVNPSFMERAISVQSEPQFICDSYFKYIDIKSMSVYSIPGVDKI